MLQENPAQLWTSTEINDRLRSQETSIGKWLQTLVELQLVSATDDRFRFAPATEHLVRQTAAVAAAYRERRIKVIEFIFSKPNEDLLSFVRAFDLRKKRP